MKLTSDNSYRRETREPLANHYPIVGSETFRYKKYTF